MRIMGFQKQWVNQLTGKPKLSEAEFTTFRWPRFGRAWAVGETVQIVMKPRTKERIPLGEAMIVTMEIKGLNSGNALSITEAEARMDGFPSAAELIAFLTKDKRGLTHPDRLTLRWTRRYDG